MQIYIGPSRTSVHHNQDVVKELQPGMLIAIEENSFPRLGKVIQIPTNRTMESSIEVEWLIQETAPHKPKWLRHFKASNDKGNISFSSIVLYDFVLTKMGALKKKSRDYLRDLFS